jgi:hypothetical protein
MPVHTNMACERRPAGRFAPLLSPFVRGTLNQQNRLRRFYFYSVPLTKGDRRGAKRPAGGRSQAMPHSFAANAAEEFT